MGRVTIVNLETLCCIARLGSFSAAAERLNTTQPAISKRVKDLEAALGVKLFRPQGRRMELTIQGRDLVQRAQPLLGRLEEVVGFRDQPAAATGIIRMGVGEIVAVTWFPQLIVRLKQQMPRVNYEIEVGLTVDMRHKLEVGRLDVAILAAPVESHQITAVPIGGIDMHWVVGATLAAKLSPQPSVAQLLEQLPLWCVARPSQMHPMAVEAMRRHGVTQKNFNTSNSVQSIVELVASGAGIAILPQSLIVGLMKKNRLVLLSPELAPERLEFVVARHRDQDQSIIERMVEVVLETSPFLRG